MRIKVTIFLVLFFILLPICFSVGNAHAQSAGDACTPTKFSSPIWVPGGSPGGAGQLMVCDGSNWVLLFEYDNDGNVGIAQDTPAAPLHVGGAAIIGTSSLICSAATEGAIRYNTTENNIEVCNGTDWAMVQASACDNAPAFPNFPDETNVAVSTLTESDIVQITGVDSGCNAEISISGTGGSPAYRVCSDSSCSSVIQTWTTSNDSYDLLGNYVQLRATSSSSVATAYTITVNIGPVSSDWIITTGMSGCSPEGTVCADGTVYAGLSGASTAMYVTRCDAGQTWDGASCTGTREALPWNNGNSTGYVTTGLTGTTDGQTYTATLIATDSDSVTSGTQLHQAAQYCADLSMHGHSDWYLPAKNELDTMYGNKTVIANFNESGTYYWSSSEYSNVDAWNQRFSDGNQGNSHKNSTFAVRCARR